LAFKTNKQTDWTPPGHNAEDRILIARGVRTPVAKALLFWEAEGYD
jgi:hypothetical protein